MGIQCPDCDHPMVSAETSKRAYTFIMTSNWSPFVHFMVFIWSYCGLNLSIVWTKRKRLPPKQEPLYQLVSSCGCKIKLERWQVIYRRCLSNLSCLASAFKEPRTVQTHIQNSVQAHVGFNRKIPGCIYIGAAQ